ncbi:(2Fe-2S)-binding protein [Actinomadura viridis]|uniref:(2Fe-2S)-binding protein n=1 Tax=Actinomadura viridis TaxID=58110 RepID=UPI0036C5BE9F
MTAGIAARRAGAGEVVPALAAAAALGPYFEIVTDPAEQADPTWRHLPERDTGRLAGLVDAYATRLGTGERRVAASILFQGLAARLWSPVIVAAARGVVPDLSSLHWRWTPGAPIALWLDAPAGWLPPSDPGRAAGPSPKAGTPAPPDPAGSAGPAGSSGSVDMAGLAGLVHHEVVERQLRPLRETLLGIVRLADGLLWGNAASALAGTLRAAAQDRDTAAPVRSVVGELLTREPLAGTGSFGRQGFVRRSCCLYYRVPPGGEMCGDCALLRR